MLAVARSPEKRRAAVFLFGSWFRGHYRECSPCNGPTVIVDFADQHDQIEVVEASNLREFLFGYFLVIHDWG